jgi:hypothetical protein
LSLREHRQRLHGSSIGGFWGRSLLFDSGQGWFQTCGILNHQPRGRGISQPRGYYDRVVYHEDHTFFYQIVLKAAIVAVL